MPQRLYTTLDNRCIIRTDNGLQLSDQDRASLEALANQASQNLPMILAVSSILAETRTSPASTTYSTTSNNGTIIITQICSSNDPSDTIAMDDEAFDKAFREFDSELDTVFPEVVDHSATAVNESVTPGEHDTTANQRRQFQMQDDRSRQIALGHQNMLNTVKKGRKSGIRK